MSTQPPPTEAERLAYAEIYAGAHNADHSMVGLKPGAVCPRCEATARAVVAAVREHLYAEVADRMLLHATEAELNDATEDAVHVFQVAASNIREWAALSRPTSKETDR